jgi:dihydropyrimidinase
MLILNGTIVSPTNQRKADILIQDGKIAGIWSYTDSHWFGAPAMHEMYSSLLQVHHRKVPDSLPEKETLVDASGCFIFPGGIDPHVHLYLSTPNGYSSDDFFSGSRAALLGGTTTIIDFVTPRKGQMLLEALDIRKTEANGSMIDYSFHVSPVEWRNSLPYEISECVAQGITSFKVYLAYKNSIGIDDMVLEKVMHAVAGAGAMLTVHAELGDDIESLRNSLYAEGKTGPDAHPLSRPPEMEAGAVKKVIALSEQTNCPVYFVHVSTQMAVDLIRDAQKRGQRVYAEVCPHHLLLDDSCYIGDFMSAAPFVLSPPLRKKADQEALWEALADGTIQAVGTDHCPFMMEQKMIGRNDFRKIANGGGGIEHRLELLYTYGVLNNRISINRFADIISGQPAKLFGLYPAKGALDPGSDAGLVIWNPEFEKTISCKNHHQHCDHNMYEGMGVKGRAEYVIARGEMVVANGELAGRPAGQFLFRKQGE